MLTKSENINSQSQYFTFKKLPLKKLTLNICSPLQSMCNAIQILIRFAVHFLYRRFFQN